MTTLTYLDDTAAHN